MSRTRRVVLVAAKPAAVGKSRLDLPPQVRRRLAAAFALDVLDVAGAVGDAVVLMTTDPGLASAFGGTTVADPVPGDLNASLASAASSLDAEVVVALLADLPALRPDELGAAVEAAGDHPAYVADEQGTGTTCLVAPVAGFRPRFGPGSAAAHTCVGARALAGDWPGLRTDVDDLGGLARAVALGVGPHTAHALRSAGDLIG